MNINTLPAIMINEKCYTLRTHIVLSYVIFLITLFIDIVIYKLDYISEISALSFIVILIILVPISSRLIWSWSNT
jgi:hypothetical protein